MSFSATCASKRAWRRIPSSPTAATCAASSAFLAKRGKARPRQGQPRRHRRFSFPPLQGKTRQPLGGPLPGFSAQFLQIHDDGGTGSRRIPPKTWNPPRSARAFPPTCASTKSTACSPLPICRLPSACATAPCSKFSIPPGCASPKSSTCAFPTSICAWDAFAASEKGIRSAWFPSAARPSRRWSNTWHCRARSLRAPAALLRTIRFCF